MAFKFRLQRVLQVKELRENLLKDKLSEAARLYNAEQGVLKEQERMYQGAMDQLRSRLNNLPSAEDVAYYHNYMQGLSSRQKRQRSRVEEVRKDLDKATADLVKASKERKAIERLKERYHLRYKKEAEGREQNQIDEIALNLYRKGLSDMEPSAQTEGGGEPK
jgi:flagellar FliJ protein